MYSPESPLFPSRLLLMSHWPELGLVVAPSCRGVWESKYLGFPSSTGGYGYEREDWEWLLGFSACSDCHKYQNGKRN